VTDSKLELVEAQPQSTFQGKIFVSSSIVDYLSSGLYKNPAACLKELINNSYDADATRVRVFVRPDANRIIVSDDGVGFSKSEFEAHFSRISESHKRDESETTALGRPKIGKIGIGFIAANELCDELRVISTKAGSDELLDVTINFAAMRKPPKERLKSGGDVAKADYGGHIRSAPVDEHYTSVFLNHVTPANRAILAGAVSQSESRSESSLYGLSAASVRDILCKEAFRTWSDFDQYSETMLRVGLSVPVSYHDNWYGPQGNRTLSKLARGVAALGFTVEYDGSELRKPIVFCPGDAAHFVAPFEFAGKHVSATGYFYVQHGTIFPQELSGLLIRIRNAAVGAYDPSFLDFPSSIGPLFQRWISAEIYAGDELEDAMNIDRSTLREAHPAYEELRAAIHPHLRLLITRARAELHGQGADERRAQRAERSEHEIGAAAKRFLAPIDRAAAKELVEGWARSDDDEALDSLLVRRFGVADLYRIVLEVARETLPPGEVARFIRALTRRLRG
jgi:hypothetical protein